MVNKHINSVMCDVSEFVTLHTLIKWPLAREWTLSNVTPQFVKMLLTFYKKNL